MKILIFLTLILFFPNEKHQSEIFEGTILYKRVAQDGTTAFEKYFFKKGKLKIESEFFLEEGTKKYKSIYLFDKSPNVYFKFNEESNEYEKKKLNTSKVYSIKEIKDDTSTVLDLECTVYNLAYKAEVLFEDFEFEATQKVWLSNKLKFEIPKGWHNSPYMTSHWDGRIILKMEETWKNNYTSNSGYVREAIEINKKKLSEKDFQLEN